MIRSSFLPALLLRWFEHPDGSKCVNLYSVTPLNSWCYRRHFPNWTQALEEGRLEARLSNLPLFQSTDAGNELLLYDPRYPIQERGA
jgi:hypothetical protein